MSRQTLIGFAGPAGAGKTSAGAVLLKHGWARLAFADRIKDRVCEIFDISRAELELAKRTDPLIRRALRVVGDHGREIKPDGHVDLARNRWLATLTDRQEPVCVDDVRFENEANAIRNDGGTIIHVVRPGVAHTRDHASEIGLLVGPSDEVLNNKGGPAELERTLLSLLVRIKARRAA